MFDPIFTHKFGNFVVGNINCGPLSDTTFSGKTCLANMRRSSPTVRGFDLL